MNSVVLTVILELGFSPSLLTGMGSLSHGHRTGTVRPRGVLSVLPWVGEWTSGTFGGQLFLG